MYPVSQAYKDAIMQPSRQFRGRLLIPKLTMNFTRNSIAYKQDGTQVPANTPRFEQGRFGQAIMVEEGTTNLNSDPFFKTGVSGWGRQTWTALEWLSNEYNPFSKQNGVMRLYDNDDNKGYCSKIFNSPSNTTYTVKVLLKILKGNISNLACGGTFFYSDDTYSDYSWNTTITTKVQKPEFGENVYELTATVTPTQDKTISKYELRIAHNDTIETELLVYAVQLEQKPYATSFIDGTRTAETLTIPTAGVLNPQEGTVECWIYVNSSIKETSQWRHIFSVETADGLDDGMALFHDKVYARFRLKTVKASGDYTILSLPDSEVPDGRRLFTVRWRPDRLSLFIDGVEKAYADNPNLPLGFNTDLWVGHERGAGHINTLIDDLRISSRAKSDEEILAAYREVA